MRDEVKFYKGCLLGRSTFTTNLDGHPLLHSKVLLVALFILSIFDANAT